MSAFQKRFIRVVEAVNDEIDAGNIDAEAIGDKQAMAATLDKGTSVNDYDVQAPTLSTQDVLKQSYEMQAGELQGWIGKIDEFVQYINGDTDASIQSKLHNATCDTMFEKIASSESKKISRVASELSALVQSFKGYLISGKNS